MKKLVILPAITLLMVMGVFALGQQSKSAHAAGSTVVQTKQLQAKQQTTVSNEKSDGTESGAEVKSTEADAQGGHQDSQDSNVNHQFNGVE